jgi:hypothetical protein
VVFLPDAKGVVAVREVEGDEVVARAGKVSQVFEVLACHLEFGTIAVEFVEVDYQSPLVCAGFWYEEHAGHVARIV